MEKQLSLRMQNGWSRVKAVGTVLLLTWPINALYSAQLSRDEIANAKEGHQFLLSTNPAVMPHAGRISLRNLSLNHAPSEKDLRRAGQLGSPLTPSREAEPSKIADHRKRMAQEEDNLLFGKAMQAWNEHRYPDAVKLFHEHRGKYSTNSPWAGEAELHLGCQAQFSGSWEEARTSFEWILANHEKGSEIYQKAKLRRAVLHLEQGQFKKAIECLTQMLESETDWERRTYAHHWIRQISVYRGNEQAMRDCGKKCIAYVLNTMGNPAGSEAALQAEVAGEHGFSIGELQEFSSQFGVKPAALRAKPDQLAAIPTPFIAHYTDRHFVVVTDVDAEGNIGIYDSRLQRNTRLERSQFYGQWSGLALVLSEVPAGISPASESDLKGELGGCCGIPRYPDDLGPPPDPKNPDPKDPLDPDKSKCANGLPVWEVNPVNMNVSVTDVPLWHDNPLGYAVKIQLTYNSQDALNQYRPFGNKWVFNYTSYAMESPGGAPAGSVLIIMPEGQGHTYQPDGFGGYISPAGVFNTLRKVGMYAFELTFPTGAVSYYGVPPLMSGTTSLLLAIEDRHHNRISINYDSNGAITSVVDSQNRSFSFFYNPQGRVSRVDDPFGRSATFSYSANGNLIGQTDMGGTSYSYTYDTNVYLASITTPSGTTQFHIEPADGINNGLIPYPPPGMTLWESYRITITDPMGFQEEYHYNGYSRYSWHRDKRQYKPSLSNNAALAASKTKYDFSVAGGAGVISSITAEDGSTIRYSSFDAQKRPQTIVDANGNSVSLTYSAVGRPLKRTDARGHTTQYEYSTNLHDLVRVIDAMGNTTTEISYTTNRDVASIRDALNRRTTFGYNIKGQLVSTTNAMGEVTTITYDANDLPVTVRIGTNVLLTSVFDAVGRLQQTTDADGQTITYTYDGRNRQLRASYSGGAFVENVWECCQLSSRFDHAGRTNRFFYDANKRMTMQVDPAGHIKRFDYDANGNLASLTDTIGRTTRWEYDALNRATAKIYADGTREYFSYDLMGNLTERVDTLGNHVALQYDANYNLVGINAPGLPSVQYGYDFLNRRTTMQDGLGLTQFTFNNASELTSVDGPWDNDTVTYSYDNAGRLVYRAIGASVLRMVYDGLGRVAETTNALGRFIYSYAGPASSRLARMDYPNGQYATYGYFPSNTHQRLQEINNRRANGTTLSRFTYGYDIAQRISTWSKQFDSDAPNTATISYDGLDQLTGFSSPIEGTLQYEYDPMGNRVREQKNGTNVYTWYNPLNEIVNSSSPTTNATTYEWDSLGRLQAIIQAGNRTEFQYDGLGRRVRIIELTNNVVTNSKSFLFCGAQICEQRDASGATVLIQFFPNGMRIMAGVETGKYFFTKDHLGSTVEVTDDSGALRSRQDFGPWGERRQVLSGISSPFSFTGDFYHVASGLYLSRSRAYDPVAGRWLSRDPENESGGINLYAYAYPNPVNYVDPNGDNPLFVTALIGAGAGALINAGVTAYRGGSWSDIGNAAVRGGIAGGVAGLTLGLAGPALAGAVGGGMAGGFLSGAVSAAAGNAAAQGYSLGTGGQCSFDWGELGISAAAGGLIGSYALRPYTAPNQTVTTWGPPGVAPTLENGRFVMTGSSSLRNYLQSGVAEYGYPPGNSLSTTVSGSSLQYPTAAEGSLGFIKGLMGQRVYTGP